jgi:hypothetical protein
MLEVRPPSAAVIHTEKTPNQIECKEKGSMRRTITIGLLVLVALVFVAAPDASAATFQRKTVSYASGDGGGGLPVPTAAPPPEVLGGWYYFCSAEPRWGEKCIDRVYPYDRNGKPLPATCGYVDFEASCGCDIKTLTLKGRCNYIYH